MLEVSKMNMTSALSAEHQRKWDESRWECKLDDPERNYDHSRVHLNFEIRKGGVVAPVDQSVCIKEKVDARIAEWKAERLAETGAEPTVRCTQHKSVCLIMGGNRDRMNELAFGNQVLQERGNNAHIRRMPEIEQFALDNYKTLAKRIGEKNIVSFIVHLDEKNCHIHATITPILEDGRLCAKDMFGGSSRDAARDKMREWHDWYASVNEKWGLERGDDIHLTGARHKSLEEHNRELHRENKSLEEEIVSKRKAVRGLSSMIANLTKQQAQIEAEIEELEAQLHTSDADKAKILADIDKLHNSLFDIRSKLEDKAEKLGKANADLERLKANCVASKAIVDDMTSQRKTLWRSISTNAIVLLKASILDNVLTEAANICRQIPAATALAENTFIDDRNYLRWNDVMQTAVSAFAIGLDGATSVAPSVGGGGTTNDMPWRDKDEDILHFAHRCMLYAHAKHYPGNRYGRRQRQ